MEEKTLFSNAWLSETPGTLSHSQCFALRITITLTAFLALPMILLDAGSIENTIAVFSVEASTAALIFSKIKSKSTTAWLLNDIEDEILEFTNTIGMAGAGTLVIIYFLA
ncbi:hypothetical protein AAG584_02630 [Vreelandella titanicae]|uniref:hypothetical protein n=1 Tax=Halomonadaceae TaxID=28256 RepID=UPI0012DA4C9F|nr:MULTISPECIES: hypothetical protein [unclassified Halomonas]NAO96198.1 hypothetical protein [Halomonas sp. MG34]QGQ69513.1 hypothetical protein FDY98_04255 [Halomonas sp. PA16-9]